MTREGVTGQGDWVQRWPEMRAVPPGAFLLAQNPETLKEKPAVPGTVSERTEKIQEKGGAPAIANGAAGL